MRKLSPKTKNALEIAGNIISSFITAIVAMVAVVFVLIKILGWHTFSIDSGSMAPLYPVDALVIVQNISPEEIRTGDVITYVLNEDGVLVTHRVIGIDSVNRTFITKGDANNNEDSPVLWDNVVGKVFLGIPAIGKPMRFLTNAENRPIVIALIVGLFVISFIWDLTVRKKRKRAGDMRSEEPHTAGNVESKDGMLKYMEKNDSDKSATESSSDGSRQ